MTPVKVCGITRAEDAALAADLGATWIGFVFWPGSPRFVEPQAAAAILARLPPHVIGVGVFVDQPPEHVMSVAHEVGLGVVQLHGDESRAEFARVSLRIFKAARLSAGSTAAAEAWPSATVLLDAHDPVRFGGTGRQVDWAAAAQVARRRRTILAGGLRSDNVGAAITRVAPYGLDISSGIEHRPGIKNHERMRTFFDAVRTASTPAPTPTVGVARSGAER